MKFKTKSGWLTDYGLSCGYKETTYFGDWDDNQVDTLIELYKEHSVYHVRSSAGDWESFNNLTLARNYFKDLMNKYNLTRNLI